jgi:hypothetical protein
MGSVSLVFLVAFVLKAVGSFWLLVEDLIHQKAAALQAEAKSRA